MRVRRSISARRSATPSERTAVRCGASPSQKGMLGGAPCASSTSTLPCGSMRWMRQLVLPSRTTSPGEESTAKCSSSVAICTFSGCSMTLKSERVGNRAAVRDGDHARAAASVQMALHAVAQQVRAVAPARAFDARVQQREQLVELRAGEIAVRPGAAQHVVERVFAPSFPRRRQRRSAASAHRSELRGFRAGRVRLPSSCAAVPPAPSGRRG